MKNQLVNDLLTFFIQENSYSINIPTTYEEKRRLLRGLINSREPNPLKEEILNKESALLQLELEEKKIVDANDFNDKIVLWQGDITTLKCDAIVNAGNKYGLGCFIPNHFCIDNQIHTYAGIRLRLKCKEILQGNMLETGNVIITSGYHLPSQYIIHTVGPQVRGKVSHKDIEDLKKCYLNSLEIAKKNHIRTIAFPCISTGIYGFPKREAAFIAYQTVMKYLNKNHSFFDVIIFNVFTDEDLKIYQEFLKK